MRLGAILLVLMAVLCAGSSTASAADLTTEQWLQDLAQVRGLIDTGYANRDWLEQDRGVDLNVLFGSAAQGLRAAHSDAEARVIFDRVAGRIGDGHFEIDWPEAATAEEGPVGAGDPCREFDARINTPGLAAALPGYRSLEGDPTFPAGIVNVVKLRVGVIRIAVFGPQGNPALCHEALQALRIDPAQPCDGACVDRVVHEAEVLMTPRFEARLRQLRLSGALTLVVDLSDNPGGSAWAEAAARMVSSRPLRSARVGFVRGPQWMKTWEDLAAKLRAEAGKPGQPDRGWLTALALQAQAAGQEAARRCDGKACERLGRGGFATGLLEQASSGEFTNRPWGPLVFSAAEYPYHDAVWSGSVVVLVNQETWSAAEEFAALLQDNHAAAILGDRTGGAGCGHTARAEPVILKNSGATVQTPDCARFRADGSNEVRGVIPDVIIGSRLQDGRKLKAKLIADSLPAALARAWQTRARRAPAIPRG
jgi:hypothetical protein